MHYPEVTKNRKCRSFIPHPKAASDNPECKNPKQQLKQVVCYFCINLSIQGTLHFMWNYIFPTPPKSTRLTKSTQFGNQQYFSLWYKRWKYNALRLLNFILFIPIIMEKKEYLSLTSLWEHKKSKYLIFLRGEKSMPGQSETANTNYLLSECGLFFPHSKTLNFRCI